MIYQTNYNNVLINKDKKIVIKKSHDIHCYAAIKDIYFSSIIPFGLNPLKYDVNKEVNITYKYYGESLDQFDISTLTYLDKFKIIEDLTFYIYYLHSNDIIHGDLRLENILINEYKKLKIIDWGLSSFVSDNSMVECGLIVGQKKGIKVSKLNDVKNYKNILLYLYIGDIDIIKNDELQFLLSEYDIPYHIQYIILFINNIDEIKKVKIFNYTDKLCIKPITKNKISDIDLNNIFNRYSLEFKLYFNKYNDLSDNIKYNIILLFILCLEYETIINHIQNARSLLNSCNYISCSLILNETYIYEKEKKELYSDVECILNNINIKYIYNSFDEKLYLKFKDDI